MVKNVLASSSVTHGSTLQKPVTLSHLMLLVHARENCSNVMFNLLKILLLKEKSLMKIIMLSGQLLVSIWKMTSHVHQVVHLQLNINAVVVLMLHGIGLV